MPQISRPMPLVISRPWRTSALFLVFLLFCGAWKNGSRNEGWGTHDWIAIQGVKLAAPDADWLFDEPNYLIGTEAPDTGKVTDGIDVSAYKDTRKCHCVLFGEAHGKTLTASFVTVNDRAALRVEQEYAKGRNALKQGKRSEAAFYLGACAHYLADLAQYMHVMGKGSRWGSEDQKLHAQYEQAIEREISGRSLILLELFVRPEKISGNSPRQIALGVAEFTDTGGGTAMNAGNMYELWKAYNQADRGKIRTWDLEYLVQTGRNVNFAINAIAKLLKLAMKT